MLLGLDQIKRRAEYGKIYSALERGKKRAAREENRRELQRQFDELLSELETAQTEEETATALTGIFRWFAS